MAHTIQGPHIQALHDTRGYEIAKGDPDIRGWSAAALDGSLVGEVEDVLVDTDALRVRYVDITLDKSFRERGERARHIAVPIESVGLDASRKIVTLDTLAVSEIGTLPVYRGRITREFEDELRPRFDADARRRLEAARRRPEPTPPMPAGAPRVLKDVETERVRQKVPLAHEEIVIERRPVQPGAPAAAPGRDEIRIPLTKEEIVVEKRRVPKEEVVIRKQTVQREEVVEADLEHERVRVRGEGDVRVRDDRERKK